MYKTKLIHLSIENYRLEELREAAQLIQNDEIVAFPTETVYGLGASAFSVKGLLKIFVAKNRPLDNPLICHFASIAEIEKVTENLPEIFYKLAYAFWPGPMTLVVKKTTKIPAEVTKNLNTVAVRIPNHKVALDLIELSGVPIAAPSANLSGKPSGTTAQHVFEDFNSRIPLIIDAGPVNYGIESTVIDLTASQPTLLRPGSLTVEEISKVIPNLKITPHINPQAVKSPGMKYRHYAPDTPLILVKPEDFSTKKYELMIEIAYLANSAFICTNAQHNHADIIPKVKKFHVIGNTLPEIQHNLFSTLREIDRWNVTQALIEELPRNAEGYAIMNRLEKAVKKT